MGRAMPVSKRMENFEKYSEYNRILRTWFVVFGISGPAALLANEAIRSELIVANELKYVVFLFLLGAGAQVLVAGINKFSNWYCYAGRLPTHGKSSRWHTLNRWWRDCWIKIIDYFWIDMIADLVTAVSFVWAIWRMLTVFAVA